mgnify:FL=1
MTTTTTLPQALELTMLLCLAAPWLMNLRRMLRSRQPEGRALSATPIILAGYCAGVLAKALAAAPGTPLPVAFWFCLLNTLTISANVALACHYRRPALRKLRWTESRLTFV